MKYEIRCAVLGVEGVHDFGVLEDGLSLAEAQALLENPPKQWVRDNTFLSVHGSQLVMFTKTSVDDDGNVDRIFVNNDGISCGVVEATTGRLSKLGYDKLTYDSYLFMADKYIDYKLFMPVIMKELKTVSMKIEEDITRDLYRRLLRGDNIFADVKKRYLDVMNMEYQDRTWDSNILSAMYRIEHSKRDRLAKFRIEYFIEEIAFAIYRDESDKRKRYLVRMMKKLKEQVSFVEFAYGFMTSLE